MYPREPKYVDGVLEPIEYTPDEIGQMERWFNNPNVKIGKDGFPIVIQTDVIIISDYVPNLTDETYEATYGKEMLEILNTFREQVERMKDMDYVKGRWSIRKRL
jgi:hypothetical protein